MSALIAIATIFLLTFATAFCAATVWLLREACRDTHEDDHA